MSPSKDEGVLEKSNILGEQLSICYQEIPGKIIKVLPGIIGSVAKATLKICSEAVGFFSKNTPVLIIFATGFFGARIMSKVNNQN